LSLITQLYHHALSTDLGDDGAAYLSEKDPLGECLRRGLEKLGTESYPAVARSGNFPETASRMV
jgi:hypothetical protein